MKVKVLDKKKSGIFRDRLSRKTKNNGARITYKNAIRHYGKRISIAATYPKNKFGEGILLQFCFFCAYFEKSCFVSWKFWGGNPPDTLFCVIYAFALHNGILVIKVCKHPTV